MTRGQMSRPVRYDERRAATRSLAKCAIITGNKTLFRLEQRGYPNTSTIFVVSEAHDEVVRRYPTGQNPSPVAYCR